LIIRSRASFRLAIGCTLIDATDGKSNITILLRCSDQSAFASACFEEAPILGLGQRALSLIGLLSHAQTDIHTSTAVVISVCVPMLPRTLAWTDSFLDITSIMAKAFQYHISCPLRQVIDVNCLYNVEQHDRFAVRFRPQIVVTHQYPIIPQCRLNPEYQVKTK
jgi:hypothetical protein